MPQQIGMSSRIYWMTLSHWYLSGKQVEYSMCEGLWWKKHDPRKSLLQSVVAPVVRSLYMLNQRCDIENGWQNDWERYSTHKYVYATHDCYVCSWDLWSRLVSVYTCVISRRVKMWSQCWTHIGSSSATLAQQQIRVFNYFFPIF